MDLHRVPRGKKLNLIESGPRSAALEIIMDVKHSEAAYTRSGTFGLLRPYVPRSLGGMMRPRHTPAPMSSLEAMFRNHIPHRCRNKGHVLIRAGGSN
jgi:hypothetical protein